MAWNIFYLKQNCIFNSSKIKDIQLASKMFRRFQNIYSQAL